MYAIVRVGNKQYRVEKGDTLLVDRVRGDEGAKLELEPLLYRSDDTIFEATLTEHEGKVGALIMEPVMMNIGIVLPQPGYLEKARELCDKHGVVLIFDEVKTGVTIAAGGAVEYFGVQPDLVCLAKSIGGGTPVGAFGGKASIMKEIENGVAGTDVRPGIIGEIGTSESILPTEERALRAAARAHRDTGLAISVHTYGFAPQALEALDILEAEGADLERVAIGHLDHGPMDIELHKAIAARGAFVEYDGFGKDGWYMDPLSSWLPHDTDRLAAVVAMLSAGFIDRLLLACDVYSRMQLTSYGGWGYEHLPRHVAPALRHLGVSTGEVERILVENPRRLLTIPNES